LRHTTLPSAASSAGQDVVLGAGADTGSPGDEDSVRLRHAPARKSRRVRTLAPRDRNGGSPGDLSRAGVERNDLLAAQHPLRAGQLADLEIRPELAIVAGQTPHLSARRDVDGLVLVLVADEDPPRTGGVRVLPPVIGERLLPDDAALREVDAQAHAARARGPGYQQHVAFVRVPADIAVPIRRRQAQARDSVGGHHEGALLPRFFRVALARVEPLIEGDGDRWRPTARRHLPPARRHRIAHLEVGLAGLDLHQLRRGAGTKVHAVKECGPRTGVRRQRTQHQRDDPCVPVHATESI
jgi:hypothetical protein